MAIACFLILVGVVGGAWELYMMTCRTDQYLAIKRHKADQKRKNAGMGIGLGMQLFRMFMK